MIVKTPWSKGLAGLLVIGGLLAACITGCRQAEPEQGKAATTTKSSHISTTTTEFIPPTTTTTKIDPMGYVDHTDEEDWPWREFNSIKGFVHWIENPSFKIEKSPFEPEKDLFGKDVYKHSYFDALYPTYQQMFAVDRFYMLPEAPSDWKLDKISIDELEVSFTYFDKRSSQYRYSYVLNKSERLDMDDPNTLAFKKNINGQEYFFMHPFTVDEKPEIYGAQVYTYTNGYLCKFRKRRYSQKCDADYDEYEPVLYSENSDLTEAVANIKFKRIDLPPLK